MFFSEKEEKIMKNLLEHIHQNPNERYILEWLDGTIVEAFVDTCYETDNGLDEEDDAFEEYFACAMMIQSIVSCSKQTSLAEGQLLEINYHNYPLSIKTASGHCI